MNPDSLAEAKRIIKETRKASVGLESTSVVICPPFPFIPFVLSARSSSASLGAQDVSFEERGSHTGDVSALALRDLGTSFVIVGHSERRTGVTGSVGETDQIVAKKAAVVVDAGMTAVVCVGEKTHDAQGAYLAPLRDQIQASLAGVNKKYVKHVVIAYEPIWAIGAKDAMDTAVVQEMTIFIRKVLSDMYGQEAAASVRVLYGGSVNFRNAGEIVHGGGVDGLLVGRESVNSPGFTELLKAVDVVSSKK